LRGKGAAVVATTLADQIREALAPHLEPGEELRAVGVFESGGNLTELPKPTFFTMRTWWVGITDRRAILAKQGRLSGKLLEDGIFSVALENVVVKRDLLATVLRVTSPDSKIPKRLQFQEFLGIDKDEFKRSLGSSV
jgi:hypothetical protein